jgi:aspartyl-tRNA(Asn)/glutamyl-tRNA(Gln) amidotransferase subunit B
MPGVLPVINEEAFRSALKAALAMNCSIPPVTTFDRKNYYYPDLPKNYQISQNYTPLGRDGWLETALDGETRKIGIDNVHLEEDAGKSVHPESATGGTSGIDLNRAGTPLLEIVSKPDMRSVEELEAFVQGLRELLRYIGVSECKMEEGQLRFEVSVSLRPVGQRELGVRVEVKNLNSVRSVLATARYETGRQSRLLDEGEPVAMETRLWDEAREVTRRMRTKEEAHDYRYFPEPDLVPVEIRQALLEELRAEIPELPLARRRRFVSEYGLPEYDAGVLTAEPELARFFEDMVEAGADPKQASNWVMVEVLRELSDRGMSIAEFPVPAEQTVKVLELINNNTITHGIAREVFAQMIAETEATTTTPAPETIVQKRGLAQITDAAELERVVNEVIAANPRPVADFRAGKKQALGALVGQVMRATQGKANPQLARRLLEQRLAQEQ